MSKKNQSPSLLEPESTGGYNATTGMDFQASLILCMIPYWISNEGFSACIWESIGDIEARFFDPKLGEVIEAIEAKNHTVSITEFWEEIERFRRMDEGSPGTYRKFTLSCTGIPKKLQPLENALRRVRDSYSFYDESSGVIKNSYEEYKQRVISLGKDEKMAAFLFYKVFIEHNWSSLNDQPRGLFIDNFSSHQPSYDLRRSELDKVYNSLHQLIHSQKNKPVTRKQIRQMINSNLDNANIPSNPIYIHTSNSEKQDHSKELCFNWEVYFGGRDRNYPPQSDWRKKVQQIDLTKEWIKENRSNNNICLSGHRRISSSFALGAIFSAVSGFSISIEQRDGEVWSTNDYNTTNTPSYNFSHEYEKGTGNELVVSIGITRGYIKEEVMEFLNKKGVSQLPKLHIQSKYPILSAPHANIAVSNIKSMIKTHLSVSSSTKVHLFYAGPGALALFLGHRWNALSTVQCYEWVNNGQYTATCLL